MNINFLHGTIDDVMITLNKELGDKYYKTLNYLTTNIEIDRYEKFVSLEDNVLTIQDKNSYEDSYRTITI